MKVELEINREGSEEGNKQGKERGRKEGNNKKYRKKGVNTYTKYGSAFNSENKRL
jgi:predicted transposase YdaD